MIRAAAAIVAVGAVLPASACTYHNTIYNAERAYDRAEAARRSGQDSAAVALYREVVDRTAEAYRARPGSDWAVEALFLLGRSRLRLGELGEARAALSRAQAEAPPNLRGPVRVYLAAVAQESGDEAGAVSLVNEALSGHLDGAALAEAHLLRGRWLLSKGYADQGWWDLDRAAEASRGARVEAALERLRWGIHHRDRARARTAADLILSYPEGGTRLLALVGAVRSAREKWGSTVAADLLSASGRAPWDREARGRVRLERARLLHEAGDTVAASGEAWDVARTLGDAAAEARVLLAHWHLDSTEDLADAYAVRSILLPAGGHPEVADLVEAVDELEVFTDLGGADPLGWFAAAEVARDRLGAEYLARGLFLAYADGAPEQPWAPKALLAALEVSPSEGDRAWLRGRLETHARSPYVLAANGGPGAGFEALEEELLVRLRQLRSR